MFETLAGYGLLNATNIITAPRAEDGSVARVGVKSIAGLQAFARDKIAECLRDTDAKNVGVFVKFLDGSLKCYVSNQRKPPEWIAPPAGADVKTSVAELVQQMPITHFGFLVEETPNMFMILEE